MTANRIEQETFITAPVERVWAVLTEPEHVVGWFGDEAEIELRPGGSMVLGFREHGRVHAVVETVEPPRVFAYRWATKPDEKPEAGNSTLVEFTLVPDGAGTLLRVVETGWTELAMPASEQESRRAENTQGWLAEIGELKQYAEAS
ncbi:MAG: SRPBCC domain-containing protein [Sporichthyaceae bacterium]|nr:SRPBCC domain-containing protein [Sporichthyaceae bacterium]